MKRTSSAAIVATLDVLITGTTRATSGVPVTASMIRSCARATRGGYQLDVNTAVEAVSLPRGTAIRR